MLAAFYHALSTSYSVSELCFGFWHLGVVARADARLRGFLERNAAAPRTERLRAGVDGATPNNAPRASSGSRRSNAIRTA